MSRTPPANPIPLLFLLVFPAACQPAAPAGPAPAALSAGVAEPGELVEDRSVYDQDNLAELPVIDLTVTDLDALEDVHEDVPGAEAPVLFQQGDFGRGLTAPNGAIRQRGRTSRLAPQKSYKIKLTDAAGRWRGQKSINLLKNPWDLTRARNYVAFELFKAVRHMTSLRHQLVQVRLNGADLGLYEWFEEPSKRFLSSHGLDEDGALYKADEFSFQPYTDDLFDCTVPDTPCLDPQENEDHGKVRRMLDAVNDEDRGIDDVIDTHFQRSNYETWLALNILLGNYDSVSQNFFLYSPSGSERWYLLPWDYNESLDIWRQPDQEVPRPRVAAAPGFWWQVMLHRRYLSVPANVASLERRIAELSAGPVTDVRTRQVLGTIEARVRTFSSRTPDVTYLPVSDWDMAPADKVREWQGEWQRLGGVVSQARRDFDAEVEWPMPLWLDTPQRSGSATIFTWDPSHDLQGDGITYDLKVARSPRFRSGDIVAERRGLRDTTLRLSGLASGTYYYYTLTIRDDDDPGAHWQIPFSVYIDGSDRIYYGVKRFRR